MNPRLRVSDAERRATVQALERHTRDGRLTLSEFDERSRHAWAARTAADLTTVTADLPPIPPEKPPSGIARSAWRRGAIIALAATAGVGLIGGFAQAASAMPSSGMMCH